jgi:hypothetical protein
MVSYTVQIVNLVMSQDIEKHIRNNLNLEDVSQLYYKLVNSKLFIVYVEDGPQRNYWNENWEFLPFAFKKDEDCLWDVDISMGITPEQEAASIDSHEDWPESFPKLNEMSKYMI